MFQAVHRDYLPLHLIHRQMKYLPIGAVVQKPLMNLLHLEHSWLVLSNSVEFSPKKIQSKQNKSIAMHL